MDSDANAQQPESDHGQLSLLARLNTLLTDITTPKSPVNTFAFSEPSSRRSAELAQHASESMRSARTRPPSPRMRNSSLANAPNLRRNMFNRSTQSLSLDTPTPSSGLQPPTHRSNQSQTAFPVLRWFTGKPATADHTPTPTQSHPGTPIEYSDSPLYATSPSEGVVSALVDALGDDPRLRAHTTQVDMPSRPKAAKLPPSLRPWRPPSHLSDLSRAALPTASLSPTAPLYVNTYSDPFDDPFAARQSHNDELDIFLSPTPDPIAIPHTPAPAHLNRSPPMLSPSSSSASIEKLRSIQDRGRGIHTTPPSQRLTFPSLPNPFSWFTSEDDAQRKANMDPYLSDEDKAKSLQAQKEHIQQRCQYSLHDSYAPRLIDCVILEMPPRKTQ